MISISLFLFLIGYSTVFFKKPTLHPASVFTSSAEHMKGDEIGLRRAGQQCPAWGVASGVQGLLIGVFRLFSCPQRIQL